jgi:uncharacterized protein YkwD
VHALEFVTAYNDSIIDAAGRTPGDRAALAGYSAAVWGESYAYGPAIVDGAMTILKTDTKACPNLVNGSLVDIGIGVADTFYVVVLAAP